MKFDFIIGNPPYQEEQEGDNQNYAPPIYDKFMDATYRLADSVELIHPARFLFNAGSTPRAWNEKMLNDPHLKVLWYEADSSQVFSNTEQTLKAELPSRTMTRLKISGQSNILLFLMNCGASPKK